MAVIQYSGLVNQIRGKLNGSTLSRNRSTNTIYRKGQPSEALSEKQAERRSLFSFVQRSWKTLTQAQRDNYRIAGQNNPVTDRFGDPKILTGYQMYMKVNIPYMIVWGDVLKDIDSSPALPMLPTVFVATSLEWRNDPTLGRAVNIQWTERWDVVPSLAYIAIYFSDPFPSVQTRFYGTFHLLAEEINPANVDENFTFGADRIGSEPMEGQSVIVRFDFYWQGQGIKVYSYSKRFSF